MSKTPIVETREIQYIGRKPVKSDTIARSGLFWPHRGAVLEVPEGLARQFLQHPLVWRDVTGVDGEGRELAPERREEAIGLLEAVGSLEPRPDMQIEDLVMREQAGEELARLREAKP